VADQVGASGLTLSAGSPGLAAVDQHAAEVRDALGAGPGAARGSSLHLLFGYARGFVEAAIGRGWLPHPGSDWESFRLAAIGQMVTQAQSPDPALPLI
jgi:hypothetical protein